MKLRHLLNLLAGIVLVSSAPVKAEQHRATFLGHPATRFAPPLRSPEDLRSLFRDASLKPDVASILRQWRWTGNVEDLHRAAVTAEITEWSIPIESTMPFMSSRKNGHPICLINVVWAGKEPAPAYAFSFSSRGQLYRCITPKACSNFFLEDLGPEPRPILAVTCTAPAESPLGRPVDVCLTVHNSGNATEPRTTVTMPIPAGVTVTSTGDGGIVAGDQITWEITDLGSNATRQICATFSARQIGLMPIAAGVAGTMASSAQTSCSTKIIGIPAILIDSVDLADPVEVGKEVIYVIKVTNQGSAPGTNVRIHCQLPASQEFISASGSTQTLAQDRRLAMDPLPALEPKGVATWRVVVRALSVDDARFKVELSSDQFELPINEEESTRQY